MRLECESSYSTRTATNRDTKLPEHVEACSFMIVHNNVQNTNLSVLL
jgi:hypothetical protein